MTFHHRDTTWFLAQLKPNCAKIAVTNLDRQGFDTFLPMEEQTRQRNNRFVTSLQPMFPGYIFVALDAAQGLWRKVNATYGITKLVSFGAAPAQVPDDLVSALMARCDQSGCMIPASDLKPGDRVTVTQGPFADIVGEITEIDPERRVWMLMDLLGRQTRLALRPEQLRAS